MKTILCFGDSNTWGYDPATGSRFGFDVRWPGAMRVRLGAGFHVVEEGLNGRTTVFEDAIVAGRAGRPYLVSCLESHKPLDLVVILLGTNDIKDRFAAPAYDVARGAASLVALSQQAAPNVLLVAPPPLARLSGYMTETFANATGKSRLLAGHYLRFANELRCHFLDAGEHIRTSDIDGVHWEADQHAILGGVVAEIARRALEG